MPIYHGRANARVASILTGDVPLRARSIEFNGANGEHAAGRKAAAAGSWSLADPAVCASLMVIDWFVIFASSMAAWFIYHELFGSQLSNWRFYAVTSAILAAIFVANGLRSSVYGFLWGVDRQERIVKVFRGFVQSFLLFVTLIVLLRWADTYSRVTLMTQFAFGSTAILALRSFQFGLLQRQSASGMLVSNRVMLVGLPEEIDGTAQVWRDRSENVQVVDTFPVQIGGSESVQHLMDIADQVVAVSRIARPDRIVILLPFHERDKINMLIDRFMELPVSVLVSTESLVAMHGRPSALTFGGLRMLRVVRKPMSATDRIIKRAFDFTASLGLIVLFAPLLAAVALAVRLDSPGPIMFRQQRKGFNQRNFSIYKFRTMEVQSADAAFSQTSRNDARITKVGRWLRRLNFDELPQLFNVLRGEMSLVGPRPHALEHDEMYYDEIAAYARRHNMKPGITGLAQAMGYRGATETLKQMADRVDHDLSYIQNWSLLLDLKILLMTVFSARAYRNAY